MEPPLADCSELDPKQPSLSYKDLIIEAIQKSPQKQATIKQIFMKIQLLYPYYREKPDQWGWKNSIRHNLALHDCFVKLPMIKGLSTDTLHYWTFVEEMLNPEN
ncbi:hypothetical protein CRE_23449 [Caenorhabditis remanei]|uniref:Fork-head domain-containing protein n=1 Tax=Caenorhabditis remanei TaxID=31234 RepID=E3MGT2_CAERE|nr:hypothetical protein CRE_23449 [Caenorhabditis remanei]